MSAGLRFAWRSSMRTKGSPLEREHRRVLAVTRLLEGYATGEVADFLGVDPRSVRRWFAVYQARGLPGLARIRPRDGPPSRRTGRRRWCAAGCARARWSMA